MRLLKIAANQDLWTRQSTVGHNYPGDAGAQPRYEGGNLPTLFEDFYRFEYAYNQVLQSNIPGKRKENILSKIEDSLNEVAEELKELFVNVFGDWLKKHAILTPHRWAEQRTEEVLASGEGFEYAWQNCFGEYIRYAGGGRYKNLRWDHPEVKKLENLLIEEILDLPEAIDLLPQIIDLEEEKRYMKEKMLEDWESDPESITSQLSLPEDAEQDAVEEAIDNYVEEEVESSNYLKDLIYNFGADHFIEQIKNIPDVQELFLTLTFEKKVFPVWMAYWEPQGIEETRETVEHAYEELVNAKDIKSLSSALSEATQVSHQTGEMLSYVCEAADCSPKTLKQTLDSLTEGDFMQQTNEDLKSIGV